MPDTPAKPTAQAMKLAKDVFEQVTAFTGNPTGLTHYGLTDYALHLDGLIDLPALLACAEVERDIAADITTVRELIGAKLREKGAIHKYYENGETFIDLVISYADIEIDWEISVLPPKVEGRTGGVNWIACLCEVHQCASGDYELEYEMFDKDRMKP